MEQSQGQCFCWLPPPYVGMLRTCREHSSHVYIYIYISLSLSLSMPCGSKQLQQLCWFHGGWRWATPIEAQHWHITPKFSPRKTQTKAITSGNPPHPIYITIHGCVSSNLRFWFDIVMLQKDNHPNFICCIWSCFKRANLRQLGRNLQPACNEPCLEDTDWYIKPMVTFDITKSINNTVNQAVVLTQGIPRVWPDILDSTSVYVNGSLKGNKP